MAAVCAYIDKDFEKDTVRDKLKQWYWCGVFRKMYGGANESRYAQDIQDLIAWIEKIEKDDKKMNRVPSVTRLSIHYAY